MTLEPYPQPVVFPHATHPHTRNSWPALTVAVSDSKCFTRTHAAKISYLVSKPCKLLRSQPIWFDILTICRGGGISPSENEIDSPRQNPGYIPCPQEVRCR